jgi:hypothetical protein
MARGGGRTKTCDATEAKQRLEIAREFLEVADLVDEERGKDASLVYPSAAASLAVLAGIAAADAASCAALQERSRSQNHHDAEELLEQIEPDGKRAARALRDLLNLKDKAQYGVLPVSRRELTVVMRKAKQLLEFAEVVVRR